MHEGKQEKELQTNSYRMAEELEHFQCKQEGKGRMKFREGKQIWNI